MLVPLHLTCPAKCPWLSSRCEDTKRTSTDVGSSENQADEHRKPGSHLPPFQEASAHLCYPQRGGNGSSPESLGIPAPILRRNFFKAALPKLESIILTQAITLSANALGFFNCENRENNEVVLRIEWNPGNLKHLYFFLFTCLLQDLKWNHKNHPPNQSLI